MVSTSKYVSIGTRREKNLADLEDKTTSLNNLLDGITGEGTFISDDLDAIRGLQYDRVNADILGNLANITIKITNPNDPDGITIPAEPLITLKDRVKKAYLVTGEVPAFRGGLGLDARFIKSSNIRTGNVDSNGSNIFIFNNQQPIEKEYWEYGYFTHGSLMDPTFSDQYGGIQWTGYFTPELYDENVSIRYETTGLLIIEYDEADNGNWTKVVSLYAPDREITPTITTLIPANTITIDAASNDFRKVAINDRLQSNPDIQITGVTSTSISLSGDILVTQNVPITFTKTIGLDSSIGSFNLPVVEQGNSIKIRISYWYPNTGQNVVEKLLSFGYINSLLPFYYMYNKKPLTPTPNEIRTYLNNAVTPYTPIIGNAGTSGANYRSLNIGKTYINEYAPKKDISEVRTAGPLTATFTAGTNVIRLNGSVINVNIGDYIIPTVQAGNLLPKRLQVKSKPGTSTVIVNQTITSSGSQQVFFVDHKGLVDWFFATSVGTTVTLAADTTATFQANNIIIPNRAAAVPTHIRATIITNATTFNTSAALNLVGANNILVYSDRGIVDNSKTVFCSGVFGVQISANAEIGNTMTVVDATRLQLGQVVQFSGYIIETPNPTTISGITGNVINLTNVDNTTTPISSRILSNSTITIAPSTTTVNKEICVLPLDTAPPFQGTNSGLSSVNRGVKSADTVTTDFEVETSNIVFTTAVNNVTALNTQIVPTYNRKIKLNNGQFFMIANTA